LVPLDFNFNFTFESLKVFLKALSDFFAHRLDGLGLGIPLFSAVEQGLDRSSSRSFSCPSGSQRPFPGAGIHPDALVRLSPFAQ
jgi:hypothetical protein